MTQLRRPPIVHFLAAACTAAALAVTAAAEPPAKVALTGGRVIPVVGEELATGTVLIEHGRITAIGTDVDIPYDAMEVDCTGKVLFPGMIHPHSFEGLDVPNETLPVAPFLDVYDAIDPSRSFFENCLRDGVTTVHVMQANNTVIGGVSRLVRPIGLAVEEMTVAGDVALKLSTSPRGGYDRMQQMAELREAFAELDDYLERLPEQKYEAYLAERDEEITVGPEEARRRGAQLITDADYDDPHRNLVRLRRGDLGAWIHAGAAMDVGPALQIARDQDILDHTVFVLGTTSFKAIRELQGTGRPVVLGSTLTYRDRDELTGEIEETFIPLEFYKARIPFSLVPGGGSALSERYLNYMAAVCVRNGIPRQAALEAITINPARAVGMGDDLGSLEPGKIANVVIFSGDPLSFDSWVEHVFIDGIHAYDRTKDPRLAELMKLEADAEADDADDDEGDMAADGDASEDAAGAGDGDGDGADRDGADG